MSGSMPECHPGTEIEIPDGVPASPFRCAIPNPKRYMKHNGQTLEVVCEAAYKGDYRTLQELLATGDERNLFNGDLNAHESNVTALHMAAMTGQTECLELLLRARADPHVKEHIPYGQDPAEGKTAMDYARDFAWDDCAALLEQAEKDTPYGWYVPFGELANTKQYNCWEWRTKPQDGFFSRRLGAAEMAGFDAMKYGVGLLSDFSEDSTELLSDGKNGKPPLPIGLLFPGQGSQYVKMMAPVVGIPGVQELLNKATDILGYDLLELCSLGPESKLGETRFCQPAMFVAGMAGLMKLKERDRDGHDASTRFLVTAGLSLGEYTALCAAGVFTFEDGLRLVQLRAAAMQEAMEHGTKQSYISIAGIEKDRVQELCEEARDTEGKDAVCQITNELFPKGFTCAGTEPAIQQLRELAESAGSLQAKFLKWHGAFHTPLMEPAAVKLRKALDEMLPRMSPPKQWVVMNVTAEPLPPGTDPKIIADLLVQQLTNPVHWKSSVKAMKKVGAQQFYEIGPMKQLRAMMKRIDTTMWGNTSNIEV